jgi:lysophospholipase L1-like esterase
MNNTILLLGSSTIRKWKNFTLMLDNEHIINKGLSRLLTRDLLTNDFNEFIIKNLKTKPKYIVFYCGINDIVNNIDNELIIHNIIHSLKNLHILFSESKILFLSLIKSPKICHENKLNNVNYVNNKIRTFCSKKQNTYFYLNLNKDVEKYHDMYFLKDRFHLNKLGYEKINEIVQDKLKKYYNE